MTFPDMRASSGAGSDTAPEDSLEMDMIERCAQSLAAAEWGGEPIETWDTLPDEDTAYGTGKIRLREMALAVLRVLRKPTDDMVARGEGVTDFVLPDCFGNTTDMRRAELAMAFTYMIDSLLADEKEARS